MYRDKLVPQCGDGPSQKPAARAPKRVSASFQLMSLLQPLRQALVLHVDLREHRKSKALEALSDHHSHTHPKPTHQSATCCFSTV